MKLLTFATLCPSAARPGHGIFVEMRRRHLLASGAVQPVASVPWFPHPRFPLVPKVGMSTAPFLFAAASARALREIREGALTSMSSMPTTSIRPG